MKDNRSLAQEGGIGVGVAGGIRWALSQSDVSRLFDETSELRDRDRGAVDREAADLDVTHRGLFGVEVGRAHPEAARGDLDHVLTTHYRDRRTKPSDGVDLPPLRRQPRSWLLPAGPVRRPSLRLESSRQTVRMLFRPTPRL